MNLRHINCILFFLTNAFLCAQNPAFMAFDEPMYGNPVHVQSDSKGELMVLQYRKEIGYKTGKVVLQKWNGQFWKTFPPLSVEEFTTGHENQMRVIEHLGEVYIAGSFLRKGQYSGGIFKWNGNQWKIVSDGIWADLLIQNEISVNSLFSKGNQLFVSGQFNKAGLKNVKNFAVLESDSWLGIDIGSGRVNGMFSHGDSTFAYGYFKKINGTATENIALYHKGKWSSPGQYQKEIHAGGWYNKGMLLVTGDSVLYEKDGNRSTLSRDWKFSVNHVNQIRISGDEIYLSGIFKSNSTEYCLLFYNGIKWIPYFERQFISPSHSKDYFVELQQESVFFSGEFNSVDGIRSGGIVEFRPGYSVLKGIVFNDKDQNCLYHISENTFSNTVISLNNGQYYTSTGTQGDFSVFVQSKSTNTIEVYPPEGYYTGCQGSIHNLAKLQKDSIIYINFPLFRSPEPEKGDLEIYSSSGYRARHGYDVDYFIKIKRSIKKYPVAIRMKFDKNLDFLFSNHPATELFGDEIHWNIYNDTVINIRYNVNPFRIKSGDTLRFVVSGLGNTDIEERLEQVVVSAFDPNDKQCNKSVINKKEKFLDYLIRFQNLGNDSAVSVFIVDTISKSLPMQYIRVLGNSHDAKYHLNYKIRDHAIIWTFNDIYLAPKISAGDDESSGYVQFRAGLINGLKVGDVITNRAYIYFDYQDPVATNLIKTEVVHTQIGNTSQEPVIYPNPARKEITIDHTPYIIQRVNMYNINGAEILEKTFNNGEPTVRISLPVISEGIYCLKIWYNSGVTSHKLVIGGN